MSAHAFGWRRFALLAGTGGGVFVLTSVLTAAFAFGDADDPLSGSDTAIILGGTLESTPSTSFAQAAEDLARSPARHPRLTPSPCPRRGLGYKGATV